jgi:hypothetical protein
VAKSSAQSFIKQILASYDQVSKAEANVLDHAITCGELLTLAKESVKAERKENWLPWLKTNCPGIPQTTASLYMRLAKRKELIVEKKPKSIREADKLIPKESRPPSNNGKEPEGQGSPDLQALLPDTAADELLRAMDTCNWDEDKRDELLKQQLKSLNPMRVFELLHAAWDGDSDSYLLQLGEVIKRHFKPRQEEDDLSIPPMLRRDLPSQDLDRRI